MCNKLVQSFACGHNKTICCTPYVHALRQHNTHQQKLSANSGGSGTSTTNPSTTSLPATALARSDSVKSYASIWSTGLLLRRGVSKLALGGSRGKARTRGNDSVSGRSRTGSEASVIEDRGHPAALVPGTGRMTAGTMGTMTAMGRTQTTPTRTQTTPTTPMTPVTPWPSISPSTPHSYQKNVEGGVGGGPGLRFAVPHSAMSSSSVDAPVPVSSLSPGTPVSLFTPTTTFTTTTTTTTSRSESGLVLGADPSTPPKPIDPAQTSAPYEPTGHSALGDGAEEPLFCDYYFPRCLTASQYPCRECYGKEEWEGLRKKWIESYRLGHPMDVLGEAEVERLSGVVLFFETEGEENVELDGVGRAV